MKRPNVHLDTGHEDKLHPFCGTYLGAGGESTPRISDATCYSCVKVAQERCLASLYEIAFNRGRKEARGEQ